MVAFEKELKVLINRYKNEDGTFRSPLAELMDAHLKAFKKAVDEGQKIIDNEAK